MDSKLAVFEGKNIRRTWDRKLEKWFFSVVDIIQILIQEKDFQTARKYWNKLKERLNNEGSETVTNCHQLKLIAEDGKMRLVKNKEKTRLWYNVKWAKNNFIYSCNSDSGGSLDEMSGSEKIYKGKDKVYFLFYAGGFIG